MLTVHHLGISQSERIVWLCEELELPYRLVRYDRDAVTRMAPADYKALHPMGIAPVITDGDLVLAESGAIIEYLIHRHGGGRLAVAADDPAYPDYLFWLHFANGTMMPSEMVNVIVPLLGVAPTEGTAKALTARGDIAFALVEARLGEARYFAGDDFTAADINMLFPLTTLRQFTGRSLDAYPNIRSYLQRIGERPAYRRAMAAGDPDMAPMLD